MMKVDLTVNGSQVSTRVEPRTSLADLLRDSLNLTGTHLGCEQGVCGACTVLVDGVPVRSCISAAVCCSGADVRSIEAFDDDPVMGDLRRAFTEHHALQCGFCTPGMLIMARDIVERLDGADEAKIRLELSGNLCRCTGYSGIVQAVSSVIGSRRAAGHASSPASLGTLGPAGSGHAVSTESTAEPVPPPPAANFEAPAVDTPSFSLKPKGAPRAPSVRQSFSVDFPPAVVWERFADVPAMIRCIPGASLLGQDDSASYQVRMRIRMGPIGAEFAGVAEQERDDDAMVGVIRGAGRDDRSSALAEGELTYSLSPDPAGEGTRVDIGIGYSLSGSLAQFARGGIVNQFIATITAQFAENLRRSLAGGPDASLPAAETELRIGKSLVAMVMSWLSALIGRLFGR